MTREGGQRRYHLLYAVSHAQSRRGLSTRITLRICMCHAVICSLPVPVLLQVRRRASPPAAPTCTCNTHMAMARIGHRQHLCMYAPMYCTVLYCTVHASLVGLPPPPLWHARQLPFTRLPLLRLCLCYLFSRILRHEQDTCRAETHSLLPLLLAASSHHRTHIHSTPHHAHIHCRGL